METFGDKRFSFDDVLLVPGYAEEDVREFSTATRSWLFSQELNVPVISSPMDTVTGNLMMDAMKKAGAAGVHHRYCDFSVMLDATKNHTGGIAISPSLGVDKVIELYMANPHNFFVVDVAHGDSKKVINFCGELKKNGIDKIVSGNIATFEAVERYLKIGVQVLRVGIGAGSRCMTRTETGFGVPQGYTIHDIYTKCIEHEYQDDVTLISDGGAKSLGDIIKAFALGADFVMSGYFFAGCDECPVTPVEVSPGVFMMPYRGMASAAALGERKKEFFVEGDSAMVEPKGSVDKIVNKIKDAILHACHYGGQIYYKNLCFVEKQFITEAGYIEGLTRK
jgi:IMP dehydrogenase